MIELFLQARKRSFMLIGLLSLLYVQATWAQQVSGTVLNMNNEPLPGVTVLVEGTTTGTVTDNTGSFVITVPDKEAILVFSFIGYLSDRSKVGDQTRIDILLIEDIQTLEELVSVGYGTQKRKDVTGSIVSINRESIQQRQATNIFDALQGQAAGVRVVTESGRPGALSAVRIRGTATIQANGTAPLYIVDGVPVGDNIGIEGVNPLDGINPNDIESIEVLKDAASAAIYGSRSANGVIIITTRKGAEGKPKFEVNYTQGYSTLSNKVAVANLSDRQEFDRRRNATISSAISRDSLNPANNTDNDYQDLITRTAIRRQVDLSASGGSKDVNYYTSLGYLDDQGIVLNTYAKTLRGRLNLDYQASDRITYGNRVQLSYQDQNRINDGNIRSSNVIAYTLRRPTAWKVYLPDGSFAPYENGERNPVAEVSLRKNQSQTYEGNIYNFLKFDLTPYLKFTTDFNFRGSYIDHLDFAPKVLGNTNSGAIPISEGGKNSEFGIYWMHQDYLNFDKTFADVHTVKAVVGFSAEKWSQRNYQIAGSNYASESVLTTNSIQDKSLTDIYDTQDKHTMASFFGRVGYSYRHKYMFDATIRRDGSSRFGEESRWGNFPSAGVAWRFSEEPFMDWASSYLQNAKLRASFGSTGNERITNYATMNRYTVGSSYYQGVGATTPASLYGNEALSWETTKQFDLGIDLSFFDERIGFTADYYQKMTSDLLYEAPLASELGYTGVMVNAGSIQNKGFEFALNTYPVRNKNVTWNLSYNMAFNTDRVKSLYNGTSLLSVSKNKDAAWYITEGGRLGDLYGYQNLGVYQYDESNAYDENWQRLMPVFSEEGVFTGYTQNGQTYEGAVNQLYANGKLLKGGDVIWLNAQQDSVINDADRVVIGNAQPKFIADINNSISYKNFNLSFNFYTSWGGKLYNEVRRDRNILTGTYLTPEPYIIHNSWMNPGDVTDVPAIVPANGTDNAGNMRASNSYWLEDASYIRLRNIRLTYTLPSALVSKLKMKEMNLYVYGSNLLTWTKYKGFDPEVSIADPLQMGYDPGRYPRSRQVGAGLHITF